MLWKFVLSAGIGDRRFAAARWVSFALLLAACAGNAQKDTGTEDEQKAERLLIRARETRDAERYRQLVTRFSHTRAANPARDELATILIEQAEAALKQRDYATAEDRVEEARVYAGLENTQRGRATLDKLDDQRAAQVASEAATLAKDGKCAPALNTVAETVRKKPRARYKNELQKLAEPPLLDCLSKEIEKEVKADKPDAARQLLNTPDATTALSSDGYNQLGLKLQKLVIDKSAGVIQPLLSEKKWSEAIAKLGELEKSGLLTAEDQVAALGLVQSAIRAQVLELAKQALSAPKPAELEAQIASLIEVAKWKVVPQDVRLARSKLKATLECDKLRCKFQKPVPAWAWGSIEIHPLDAHDGPATGKLKHAQKVWVVAKTKDVSLIASEDPGSAERAALIDKAVGWVQAANLKPADTELWLPPPEELVGVQVWGPLRPNAKEYFLGVVTKVEADKVTVRRYADGLTHTVDAASLRAGKLTQGLKVMAFCADQLHSEPAKIDSVVSTQGGSPRVQFLCDKGGMMRVDMAGSLSSKPEWLPPRKP